MTPVFCCGFECGVSDAAGHWVNTVNTFSTTGQRSGARALRAHPTAQTTQSESQAIFSSNTLVGRIYIYFATLPSTDLILLMFHNGATTSGSAYFQQSDGKIYAHTNANGATGVSVTTGTWYRIDLKVNASANPLLVDVQVNGTACGQATQAVASATLTTARVLYAGSWTGDVYADDLVVSATSGDYPIGAGYVNHFVPTSDGTHNVAGANDFERTLTGTDITNATTDAYLLVQTLPLPSGLATGGATFVNNVAPPNATDYVQCKFGAASGSSTPTVAPRAVEVIATIAQAGTGNGNMEIRLNDNGTTNAIYTATGVAGVTSFTYKRKHYASGPAGAWTVVSGAGNFNNLQVQFGSPAAVDANPDQYYSTILIEAEFPTVVTRIPRGVSVGHPFII